MNKQVAGKLLTASLFFAAAMLPPQASAQDATPKPPEFEVASIKPAQPDPRGGRVGWVADGFQGIITTKNLMSMAYSIRSTYIFDAPGWTDSSLYSVNAKIDDTSLDALKKMPPKEVGKQYNLMVQSLLRDRFKLQVRKETKELPVYALVIAKGGPKFKPSAPAKPGTDGKIPPEEASVNITFAGSMRTLMFRQMSMDDLPGYLIGTDRKILNETGLQGKYDFDLQFQEDTSGSDNSGPSLFTALREQLGLKLEPRKGPVETLVVEHIEKPSEN